MTSRDPLNAQTRSAYGYAGNSPLNGSDPSGLYCMTGVAGHDKDGNEICNTVGQAVRDGLGICSNQVDEGCQSAADSNPAGAQATANVAGGIVERMSFGLSNHTPLNDHVRTESSDYQTGRWIGWGISGLELLAAPGLFGGLSTGAALTDFATSDACKHVNDGESLKNCLWANSGNGTQSAVGAWAALGGGPFGGAACWLLNSPWAADNIDVKKLQR